MPVSNILSCEVRDLGLIGYQQAYDLQTRTVQQVILNHQCTLLLCEHPPVLTLGRMSHEENILFSREAIKKKGIDIVDIDRGGDVTLHSPGQLVVYPIFDLNHFGRDLHSFLHKLEKVAIDLLRGFDIVANRFSGRTGVWVANRKIVSLGIGVRKWISYHGMGINVNTDLNLFSVIKPCGLDVQMTSIAELKGRQMDIAQVKQRVVQEFAREFQMNFTEEQK